MCYNYKNGISHKRYDIPCKLQLEALKGGNMKTELLDRVLIIIGIVVGIGLAFCISYVITELVRLAHPDKVTEMRVEHGIGRQEEADDIDGPELSVVMDDETETEYGNGFFPTTLAGFGSEQADDTIEAVAETEAPEETEKMGLDTRITAGLEREIDTETKKMIKPETGKTEDTENIAGNYADTAHLMEPGKTIDPVGGVFQGPWLKETYYNLDMSYCIEIMRWLGIDKTVWVRSDGVKMYGEYIMCAADTKFYPKGSIVETSLGRAMVVDHCEAAEWCPEFDIAVTW